MTGGSYDCGAGSSDDSHVKTVKTVKPSLVVMDSIRRRISAHMTGSRIRKAWLDYKVAEGGGVPSPAPGGDEGGDGEGPRSAFAMLTEFIESVYSGEGAAGLISEGLNAEWGDIMTTLLDVAGQTKGPATQEEAFSPGALKNIRWKVSQLL